MRNALERSRYAQIALTYTKPLPFRIWAVVAAIGGLWIAATALIIGGVDYGTQYAMLFLGGSLATWGGAMIAAHANEQLADARSALVPGFRTPHLVVAAAMFLVVVVGLAWGVAAVQAWTTWRDVWAPGYVGFVLAITALLAWMGQLQTPVMLVPIALAVSPVLFAEGRVLLSDVMRGRAVGIGYAVLAVSVAALVALGWRLAMMKEAMREYGRAANPGLRLRVRMTGDPAFRRESAAGASRVETFVRQAARFDAVANVAAAGFWRRAWHWRHVVGMGRMAMFVALLLGAWVPVLQSATTTQDVGLVVALLAASMVPGQMLAAVWPRRWYVLADESMRPASRRQFVREQGAAMALEHAATWAWLTSVSAASAVLFAHSPGRVFGQIMLALPLMAGVQVLNFGLLVWILRFRAGWLIIAPIFLVTITGVAALIAGGDMAQHRQVDMVLLMSLLLTIGGAGITLDAYRRWLVTEFD